MKKSKIISALVVTTIAVVLARSVSADEFKVGLILPLSGRTADYGIAAKNGIELARKEHSPQLTNVRFSYQDSLYDGKTTITIFNKLTSIDDVDLVFVWGHGPCAAVAPVAEARKVPTVVITGDRSVSVGRANIIRFFIYHEQFGKTLLGYLRKQEYKRLGIVKTELGFLNHIVNGIMHNITKGESVELVDNYQTDSSDFKTSIVKLKTRKYDAVGVFVSENQVAPFFKQALSLDFKAPVFGAHSFASEHSISESKGALTGAVYPAIKVDENFKQRYIAEYKNDAQISFAANAYDFAVLVGEVFGTSKKSFTAKEIVVALKSVQDHAGMTGPYSYAESKEGGGFNFPLIIRQIQKDNSTAVLD